MNLMLFSKLRHSNNKSPELYKPRAFSCCKYTGRP